MNILINDDLNIKKYIPAGVFIIIWEILIACIVFSNKNVYSLVDIMQLAAMIVLPLLILVITLRSVCKIIYNSTERRFVIRYLYKKVIINEDEVDRLEIFNGKEFIGDYGISSYEILSIIGINGKELFRYKTNAIETPDLLIENLKRKIVCVKEII